jgi:hypothetical protein
MESTSKTNTAISNNKLDNVIRDNEKRICLIIHIAISGNRNVIKKKPKIFLKTNNLYYRNTACEYCKNKVISVIRPAAETIAKSFRTYLNHTHA